MGRLIVAILCTVAVVAFSMTNTHHVELSFVIGDAIKIRLISLLAVTFITGALTVYFYQAVTRVTRRSEHPSRSRFADVDRGMEAYAE
jgi:uncharacterized integral membrane protein